MSKYDELDKFFLQRPGRNVIEFPLSSMEQRFLTQALVDAKHGAERRLDAARFAALLERLYRISTLGENPPHVTEGNIPETEINRLLGEHYELTEPTGVEPEESEEPEQGLQLQINEGAPATPLVTVEQDLLKRAASALKYASQIAWIAQSQVPGKDLNTPEDRLEWDFLAKDLEKAVRVKK